MTTLIPHRPLRDYVLGFLTDATHVALIRKQRPTWQRGFLNGIGGRVEPGEAVASAMAREFVEETGYVPKVDWRLYAIVNNSRAGYRVWCFHAVGNPRELHTVTDETIEVHPHSVLPDTLVSKVRWLVPLALDGGHIGVTELRHQDAEIGDRSDDDRPHLCGDSPHAPETGATTDACPLCGASERTLTEAQRIADGLTDTDLEILRGEHGDKPSPFGCLLLALRERRETP